MISRTWTQRIGIVLACLALLSFLASQIPAPASPQVLLAEQNGYNVFSVLQTFAAGAVITGTLTVNGATVTGSPQVKCINIDPSSSTTNWIFWKAGAAMTVTGINCLTDVATSTAALTLQECDSNGANCGNTEAAITCSTTNATQSGGIDDSAVDLGDWMRVTRGATANSPLQATLCMTYTIP